MLEELDEASFCLGLDPDSGDGSESEPELKDSGGNVMDSDERNLLGSLQDGNDRNSFVDPEDGQEMETVISNQSQTSSTVLEPEVLDTVEYIRGESFETVNRSIAKDDKTGYESHAAEPGNSVKTSSEEREGVANGAFKEEEGRFDSGNVPVEELPSVEDPAEDTLTRVR